MNRQRAGNGASFACELGAPVDFTVDFVVCRIRFRFIAISSLPLWCPEVSIASVSSVANLATTCMGDARQDAGERIPVPGRRQPMLCCRSSLGSPAWGATKDPMPPCDLTPLLQYPYYAHDP